MNPVLRRLIVLTYALLITACQSHGTRKPNGHYSDGRWGVFVFREDGVFGYTLATKFDFYDKDNLPPETGRWLMNAEGELEIQFDEKPWKTFNLDWSPETDSFDLIFDDPPKRDFPPVINYNKG